MVARKFCSLFPLAFFVLFSPPSPLTFILASKKIHKTWTETCQEIFIQRLNWIAWIVCKLNFHKPFDYFNCACHSVSRLQVRSGSGNTSMLYTGRDFLHKMLSWQQDNKRNLNMYWFVFFLILEQLSYVQGWK